MKDNYGQYEEYGEFAEDVIDIKKGCFAFVIIVIAIVIYLII